MVNVFALQNKGEIMKPIALLNLKGSYEKDVIRLSWKAPVGAPDTVFVCPIQVNGMKKTVDKNKLLSFVLNKQPNGLVLPHQGTTNKKLARIQYMAFLGERFFNPCLEDMLDNPDYIISVTVGSAKIQYSIKEKEIEKGFVQHVISLKSSCVIPFGILYYSFIIAGQRFLAALPQDVEIGETVYPPFITQPESKLNIKNGSQYGVSLEVSEDAKANIELEFRKRLSRFSFTFFN